MNFDASTSQVDDLLYEQYCITIRDVDEKMVEHMIIDGEDPQAIVDHLAEKFDLIRVGEMGW